MTIYEKAKLEREEAIAKLQREIQAIENTRSVLDGLEVLTEYYGDAGVNCRWDGRVVEGIHCNKPKQSITPLIESFEESRAVFCDYGYRNSSLESFYFGVDVANGEEKIALYLHIHPSDLEYFASRFDWNNHCFTSPGPLTQTLCADEAKEAFIAGKL